MTLRALGLGLLLLPGTAISAAPGPRPSDAYVLSLGSEMSISGSLEDLDSLRRRFPGDFLWFRRAGAEYVMRDAGLIGEAQDLFAPLEALHPEQQEIARREEVLEREEEKLDAEHDDIDAEREDLSWRESESEEGHADDPDQASRHRELDEREESVENRLRELRSRQRSLEAEESALDERQDRLEDEAERKLWVLLDRSIGSGRAQRLPRR